MTTRALSSTLVNSLIDSEHGGCSPFNPVHLVKFEKPSKYEAGVSQEGATDYTYLTDAQYDIIYDDGSVDLNGEAHGAQTYRANKLTSLGTINENILAKASNLAMTMDSSSLGASASATITFDQDNGLSDLTTIDNIDFRTFGFQEGDKIYIRGMVDLVPVEGFISSHPNSAKYVRIEAFKNDGKTIVYSQITPTETDATELFYNINLAAEELNTLLSNKGGATYSNYINREVFIYKAHIDPTTQLIIGGNALDTNNYGINTTGPYLFFKGITSGCSIIDKLESSEIKWTLSSHWGDFLRVQGRLTDDEEHRALQPDGSPNLEAVIKPSYAGDLGFLHANSAVNVIATYNVRVDKVRTARGDDLQEYTDDEIREVDLRFNPQAKMLPVVYGVRKVSSFPIFVDTDKEDASIVYRADAICEGPIAGILDIHIDDSTSICINKQDYESRSGYSDGLRPGLPAGVNVFNKPEAVEIQCYGRQDRGDTLKGFNASTGAVTQFNYNGLGSYGTNFVSNSTDQYTQTGFEAANGAFVPTGASNSEVSTDPATGILHGLSHNIDSPIKSSFTFHAGVPNQKADDTLVGLSSNNKFKVQSDYYEGNEIYWGPTHQVLDTAYVVGKFTISDGETSLPDTSFVVRGRDPECYNYDGSYKNWASHNSNSSHTVFQENDYVYIRTLGNNDIESFEKTYRIMDKWSTFDIDGNPDYRFRFSPTPEIGDHKSFYMQKVGTNNKWIMQTWDNAENSQDLDQNSAVKFTSSGISSWTAVNSGEVNDGTKITLTNPSTAKLWALQHSTAVIGMYNASNKGTLLSSYSDFTYANNIITVLSLQYSALHGTAGHRQGVFVKNAIQLNDDANTGFDGYYNGWKITLTHAIDGVSYRQVRTITDYDTGTKMAMVDEPWSYNYMPGDIAQGSSYALGTVGDRRVTLNPAMQLLDYLTNIRYGKGLDIDKDINLPSFLSAARECDTRSDVTLVVPAGSTIAIGDQWKLEPTTGTISYWRGTVSSIDLAFLGGIKQVTFTDCTGKLGTKWNSWQVFPSGSHYWHEGLLYAGANVAVPTAPSSGATGAATIKNVVTSATITLDLAAGPSANGNPLAKKYAPESLDYSGSGYSLYDSDDVKYWRYVGWDSSAQRNVTRHQMNQVIDTQSPLFSNINTMLKQFNGMLRYSVGKYELDIKGKTPTLVAAEKISNSDIIGTVKLSDKGLKNSKNYVSTSILDPSNKFEGRSVSFFNSLYLKEDKGIQKKGSYSLPGVTNYFNARFNIKQFLDESRYGLQIQFTMSPRGLLFLAGNIIAITYPRFGYVEKEFRIINLNFKKDGLVDVIADEHNDDAYVVLSEGSGYGVVNDGGVGPNPQEVPARPTGLVASQYNQAEIALGWTQSDNYRSSTHETQIWMGPNINSLNQGTDGTVSATAFQTGTQYTITDLGQMNNTQWNVVAGTTSSTYVIGSTFTADTTGTSGAANDGTDTRAVHIGTSDSDTYHDLVSTPISSDVAQPTRYYWIRYMVARQSVLAGSPQLDVPSLYFPSNLGISGTTIGNDFPRVVKILPGGTGNFVYNIAGTALEGGSYQTNTLCTLDIQFTQGTVSYVWKLGGPDGTVQANEVDPHEYTYTPPEAFGPSEILYVEITDTVSIPGQPDVIYTATDSFTFTFQKLYQDGVIGADGSSYTSSNGYHLFEMNADGEIGDVSGFRSSVSAVRGNTALSFQLSPPWPTDQDTFSFGAFSGFTANGDYTTEGEDPVIPIVNAGIISIAGSGNAAYNPLLGGAVPGVGDFIADPLIKNVTFDLQVYENTPGGTTINDREEAALFRFSLSKALFGGARGGSIFTFDVATSNITSTDAAAWASDDYFTITAGDVAAPLIAALIMAASEDNFIRPNDRITVTDNNATPPIAATRVYLGAATDQSTSLQATTETWSSLVIETFPGSVIVEGTLSADRLAANTTVTNRLNVSSTLMLGTGTAGSATGTTGEVGVFHTYAKTTFTDPNPGFWLGYDGTEGSGTNTEVAGYKLIIGNSANFLRWNAADLFVQGTISLNTDSTYTGPDGNTNISTTLDGNTVALEDIADDDKVTPSEKQLAKMLWNKEEQDHNQLIEDWYSGNVVGTANYYWHAYDEYTADGTTFPEYEHPALFGPPTAANPITGNPVASNGIRLYQKKFYQLKRYLGLLEGKIWYDGPNDTMPVQQGTIDLTYGPLKDLTTTYDLANTASGPEPVSRPHPVRHVNDSIQPQIAGEGGGRELWNRMWAEVKTAKIGAQNAQEHNRAAVIVASTEALADMAADNKITPTEKLATKEIYDAIVAEKDGIASQANTFSDEVGGLESSTLDDYLEAYNRLVAYMTTTSTSTYDQLVNTGTLINMTVTTTIIRATWDTRWGDYYEQRANLLEAIGNLTTGTLGINTTTLADIAADNRVTPSEKEATKISYDAMLAEYIAIYVQIVTYLPQPVVLGDVSDLYGKAYLRLLYYMTTTSTSTYDQKLNDGALLNMTVTSDITRSTWNLRWADYYSTRTSVLNDISAAIAASTVEAVSELAAIAEDNKLTPTEKSAARVLYDAVLAEYQGIYDAAVANVITDTLHQAYYNKYQALVKHITNPESSVWGTEGSSMLDSMSVTSTIDRSQWNSKWGGYYDAKAVVIEATHAEARAYTTTLAFNASSTAGNNLNYINGEELITFVHMTGNGLVVKAGTTPANSMARVKIGNLSAL